MKQVSFFLTALRAAVLETAVLAGHLLLYPTGVFQERPDTPQDTPGDTDTPDSPGTPGTRETPNALGAQAIPDTPNLHTLSDIRGPRPVLLLHGFVDNRSVFTVLRRSLARNGWPHVIALNYSPLTCDIRTAAELLGRHVEEICERTGHRQLDIVGHSLGGLIARYYAQRQGGDSRVHTLVTLGTPHSGTRVVPPMSAHPIVRQMRPHSDVLEELAGPAPGCRTRFISFWSDLDELMSPLETARLDHPDLLTRSVPVHGIGHLSMPVHWAVTARIREELTESHLFWESAEAPAGVA